MKAKKIVSLLMSLVLAVTAMSMFAVSASAAVKTVASGTKYSATLSKNDYVANYKIKVSKSGSCPAGVGIKIGICTNTTAFIPRSS